MRTLAEKKKVCYFNCFILFAMALGLAITFTACSSDDDSNIPVYSLKDVDGTYSGKMQSTSVAPQKSFAKEEQLVGVEVNAEVKDNQIIINKFPVDDLIKNIIQDQEIAQAIIEAIGDINYKIPYTAAFDENKGNILLQLQPEPLVIQYTPPTQVKADEEGPSGITVTVTIKADEQGKYTYKGNNLKFSIEATKVEIGDEIFAGFPATTFSFDMAKK